VTIWGLRLSLHILTRNWGKPEDFRYQTWREKAGASWWWRSFFKVFFLQGVILWIVASLCLPHKSAPARSSHLDRFHGNSIWLIGFPLKPWEIGNYKGLKPILSITIKSCEQGFGDSLGIPIISAMPRSGGPTTYSHWQLVVGGQSIVRPS